MVANLEGPPVREGAVRVAWTPDDERELADLWQRGWSDLGLAEWFGRSARAIVSKRQVMGLTRRHKRLTLEDYPTTTLIGELRRRGHEVQLS